MLCAYSTDSAIGNAVLKQCPQRVVADKFSGTCMLIELTDADPCILVAAVRVLCDKSIVNTVHCSVLARCGRSQLESKITRKYSPRLLYHFRPAPACKWPHNAWVHIPTTGGRDPQVS